MSISREVDDYLDGIDRALTVVGLRPVEFTVCDTNELAADGLTALPSAELTWLAGHSTLDHEQFPYGAIATWTASMGWQVTALQADGTESVATRLSVTAAGEPGDPVNAIARLLLGTSFPARATPDPVVENPGVLGLGSPHIELR
ncbi:hypothetical protein ACWC5I_02600 [Kitasatospora sp. NPDC001574]